MPALIGADAKLARVCLLGSGRIEPCLDHAWRCRLATWPAIRLGFDAHGRGPRPRGAPRGKAHRSLFRRHRHAVGLRLIFRIGASGADATGSVDRFVARIEGRQRRALRRIRFFLRYPSGVRISTDCGTGWNAEVQRGASSIGFGESEGQGGCGVAAGSSIRPRRARLQARSPAHSSVRRLGQGNRLRSARSCRLMAACWRWRPRYPDGVPVALHLSRPAACPRVFHRRRPIVELPHVRAALSQRDEPCSQYSDGGQENTQDDAGENECEKAVLPLVTGFGVVVHRALVATASVDALNLA